MDKKNIDWANLGFGYVDTDKRFVANFKDGKWDDGVLTEDSNVVINECAGVLQYAQTIFEGMKAYTTEDGRIVTFRPDLNASRFADSARRLEMPVFPEDKFVEAIKETVKANAAYVPPYGSGATLYIRPYMFGTNPVIGVKPADEYQFRVFATPVGPYFKGGFKPSKVCIMREYDRAAPQGTGTIKVGGNYAASLVAGERAHELGYAAVLYLDPKEKKYLDECGPANFFGIRGNSYITPQSHSILPSITNKSLQQLAADMGLTVERRPIPVEEIATFDEAAELAYFGAKILHPSSVQPAKKENIPVRLKNTLCPDDEGTLITEDSPAKNVKAVATKSGITAIKIKSTNMLLAYGFLRKVFEVFEAWKTPIDMIATSEVAVSLTIDCTEHLEEILKDLEKYGTIEVDRNMAIVCIVGDFSASKSGLGAQVLKALEEVPLRMISYGGSAHNIKSEAKRS